MASKIPNDAYVIIIGAMKSGTTSLYDYLAKHPAICAASTKEPEFFSVRQSHRTNVNRYCDLWEFDSSRQRYALEASTGYTKYPLEPGIPKAMYDYGIRPKFLYIVRNPFDRLVSHYWFMKKQDHAWNERMTSDHLVDTSNYYLQLRQFCEYFPASSFLVMDFDELKSDPNALLRRIYSFLGLPEHVASEYLARNRTSAGTLLERRLRSMGGSHIARLLPAAVRPAVRRAIGAVQTEELLSSSERQVIRRRLESDMHKLSESYGIDVSKWGF